MAKRTRNRDDELLRKIGRVFNRAFGPGRPPEPTDAPPVPDAAPTAPTGEGKE